MTNPLIVKVDQLFIKKTTIEESRFDKYEILMLQEIVTEEDYEALDYYVETGFNINVRTAVQMTVIHIYPFVTPEYFQRMVDLGFNPYSINRSGENLLLSLTKKEANVPLQQKLMDLGVNPYEMDFAYKNCFSYVEQTTCSQPKSFYEQVEAVPVNDYPKMLANYSPEYVLDVLYAKINNLGGFKFIIKNLRTPAYFNIFYNLQHTLAYLGRTNEASALIRLYLNEITNDSSSTIDSSFVAEVAFIEKDYDLLFTYLKSIIENSYSRKSKVERAIVIGCLFAKIVENKKEEKYFIRQLKQKVKNGFRAIIKNLILANSEIVIQTLKEVFEETKKYNLAVHVSELEYLYALYCLSNGDFLEAELEFRKNMQRSINNGIVHFKEYPSSLLLMKYTQKKNNAILG